MAFVGLECVLGQQSFYTRYRCWSRRTAHLAGRRVAAVEAHEGIGQLIIELAGDVLIINVLGHTVVDVQQGDGVAGGAHTDVLGQGKKYEKIFSCL